MNQKRMGLNKSHVAAAGISFLLFLSFGAGMAQVTATGHVTAEVIDAITAVESSAMSFGRFSAGDQGGSIVISPGSGKVLTTATVVPAGNEIIPAAFFVSGASDAAFSVTLPTGCTRLTSETGTGTLTLSDWAASSSQGSETGLLAGGSQTVKVGATLNVSSGNANPRGFYTGSYQVTFSYN